MKVQESPVQGVVEIKEYGGARNESIGDDARLEVLRKEPLVSVIVPCYNVEKYFDRCMESLAAQTYKNIEIILIDDGSTDGTSSLCEKWERKDARVRLMTQEVNRGLSAARNLGVSAARGDFLCFVDSDDRVTEDMVSYLYSLILKYDCPMSTCEDILVRSARRKIVHGNGTDETLPSEEAVRRLAYDRGVHCGAYGKLCRRELLAGVSFPEGKLFEDIGTTYKLFFACERVACGYSAKYFYYRNPNSITTKGFTPAKLDLLEMTDKMAAEVAAKWPKLERACLRRRVYARFSTLNTMLDIAGYEREKREIIRFARKHKWAIWKDPEAPLRDKLAEVVLLFGLPFYRWVWKLVK